MISANIEITFLIKKFFIKFFRNTFAISKSNNMKTIIFLSVATIGMSSDNFIVMSGALLICGILIFKKQ